MKFLLVFFSALAFAFTSTGNASSIKIDDLTDTVSVTVDGTPLTGGNISWITNVNLNGENVSFDVSTNGLDLTANKPIYTTLLEPGSGVESDRLVITFPNKTTYHVEFGSDPLLPTIPTGATGNVIYESGGYQLLAYVPYGGGVDNYYARSDAPIPAAIWLSGSALVGVFGFARRKQALNA